MPRAKEPLRELWICPKCGARLVTRNLAHSCGRSSEAMWEARMTAPVRALYVEFKRRLASCGPIFAAPAKTRIAFLARVRFAGVAGISDDAITISFSLPTPLRSKRFTKVEEVAPGWWVHRLRITDAHQFDTQLQGWLCESYRLMGMQERLRKKRRRATKR